MLVAWVCGSLTRSLLKRVEALETLNRETIFAFVRAIDARDPYTARHSEKVAAYAVQLAQALGLKPPECERIRLAGLLHDVGKLALERSVLHKTGPLSQDEWRQVREHPGLSAHIIGGVAHFAPFLPGARHHHERYDGRGYPDGLSGTEIPLDARVLAVADAYDAMTSDRSYRGALPHADAIERLEAGAGSQFDPICVEAFATLDLDDTRIDAREHADARVAGHRCLTSVRSVMAGAARTGSVPSARERRGETGRSCRSRPRGRRPAPWCAALCRRAAGSAAGAAGCGIG